MHVPHFLAKFSAGEGRELSNKINYYINQHMHLIKYNSRRVYLNSYMFRHRGAIIRELFRTEEYKANTLI